MRSALLAAAAVAGLALGTSLAQAATLSIDDTTDSLRLFVNGPTTSTNVGDLAPGTGDLIDFNSPTDGISNVTYNAAKEMLSFTFANQINWNGNVYFYEYFTDPDSSLSDLFVIQGKAGAAPDYISFVSASSPGQLTGDITTDAAAYGIVAQTGATPQNLGNIAEQPTWQLAYDTGVDQYYMDSVPEPASLMLLGAGLTALGLVRRRRRG